MIYGRYKGVRNASWQAIIDYNVTELPVGLISIAKQANILIVKNSLAKRLKPNERGISIYDGQWIIVYDDTQSSAVSRFTIAHEFGHIFLGHRLKNGYYARTFEKRNDEEQEADMFAARLLAPACVLWGLKLHTTDEISAECKISKSAAKIRAERMKILYNRNKFLTSPLERQVYNQFSDYIKNHSQSGYFESDK